MISVRSKITQAVLNYFLLEEGKEVYINELARQLSLDSGNLTRKLIELEKNGILKSRWLGEQRYYSLNKDYPLLKEYKNIILKTLGFEFFLKEALGKIPGISKALIFGSYAEDKMDSASDIDLLVVGDHNAVEVHKVLAELQKKMSREINVVNMTGSEYKSKKTKKDPFLMSIDSKPQVKIV